MAERPESIVGLVCATVRSSPVQHLATPSRVEIGVVYLLSIAFYFFINIVD